VTGAKREPQIGSADVIGTEDALSSQEAGFTTVPRALGPIEPQTAKAPAMKASKKLSQDTLRFTGWSSAAAYSP
jgi:hypothetical protein